MRNCRTWSNAAPWRHSSLHNEQNVLQVLKRNGYLVKWANTKVYCANTQNQLASIEYQVSENTSSINLDKIRSERFYGFTTYHFPYSGNNLVHNYIISQRRTFVDAVRMGSRYINIQYTKTKITRQVDQRWRAENRHQMR